MPSYVYENGRMIEVPDLFVSESGELHQDVENTMHIESGVSLVVHGRVAGTLEVRRGATLDARGDINGTVHVAAGAEAVFHKGVGGTLYVERGATATLAESAVALGAMYIEGRLLNFGTRGLEVRGSGKVEDLEGSIVRQPDETTSDGSTIYYG